MYEYGICNNVTNERNIIFGITCAKAFEKANLDPNEWFVEYAEYID